MNDHNELETVYSEIQKEYSLNPKDSELDRLGKLLAESNIGHFAKDKYIQGLEQLVSDLKDKIAKLESVVTEAKK